MSPGCVCQQVCPRSVSAGVNPTSPPLLLLLLLLQLLLPGTSSAPSSPPPPPPPPPLPSPFPSTPSFHPLHPLFPPPTPPPLTCPPTNADLVPPRNAEAQPLQDRWQPRPVCHHQRPRLDGTCAGPARGRAGGGVGGGFFLLGVVLHQTLHAVHVDLQLRHLQKVGREGQGEHTNVQMCCIHA